MLIYVPIFLTAPECFDYCSFAIKFKVEKFESAHSILLFNIIFNVLAY